MELEEMKTIWGEMSAAIEKQKMLTDALIIRMTQADYRNKINKILIPEAVGSAVCFAAFLFILINLQKLDPWYLMVCGIMSSLIIILLPVLSVKAIYKMHSINIGGNNYKQSLLEYSKGKLQFVFVQKLTFYLGSLLILTLVPVMGKLIANADMFKVTRLWYCYVIMFPFFYWFATWVFKQYRKIIQGAENILKELEI